MAPPRPTGIPPSAVPNVLVISPGDRIPDQVVCLDTPINIVFSGFDDDELEGSQVILSDVTGGAASVFEPPLNAVQSKFYDASSRVSQTMLSLLVGKSNGFTRDDYGLPLSPRPRRLCVYMVDNTFDLYGRYGDWPYSGYASASSCFSLVFVGPPEFLSVFIGLPRDSEWPPLDFNPSQFNLLSGNESTSPVVDVGLGSSIVVSFMAADSSPSDTISFLTREDPGLPSSNSSLFPVKCIPRKVFDPDASGAFTLSPCSLAVASVAWTILLEQLPSSYSNGQFSVPLCLIARDSSTSCTGTSPAATAAGWYSAPGCVRLRVVMPALSWTAPSMRNLLPHPVISVGVDCSFRLTALLINNSSAPTDMPVRVSLSGNATDLLVGRVQVVAQQQPWQQWHVGATFQFSAAHQGLRFTACFDAVCDGVPASHQRVCAIMVVRVCSACTHPHSSLYSMAVKYFSSSNWYSLQQLNHICSPGLLCISNSSLLPVSSSATTTDSSGNVLVPGIRIGHVVAAQSGDAAATLARAWNTSETLVARLNPSRAAGVPGEWCVPQHVREDE